MGLPEMLLFKKFVSVKDAVCTIKAKKYHPSGNHNFTFKKNQNLVYFFNGKERSSLAVSQHFTDER